MQHWKKILLGLLATTLVALGCASSAKKTMNAPTSDPRWSHIDSLADKGLFAQALTATEAVLARAQADNDQLTEFRAWMYKARFQQYTGTDPEEMIVAIEQRAASTSAVPLKPLLHAVIGQHYWDEYQDDRWEILERTPLAEAGADPTTWDQAAYMHKVITELQASLQPADTLAQLPIGDLAPLLLPEADELRKAAATLRPTVLDLLAHRALAIFRNTETRLSEPAWRFQLDDPKLFDLFEAFARRTLTHRDSTAWEFQAVLLYQRLERLHLRDTKPDALVDVTLDRLRYVHERSTLADKDSLLLHALTQLQVRLPKDPCEAEVMVAIAQWHVEQGAKYQRLDPEQAWKWEKRTARTLCEQAIAKWPGSFGARNAQALAARLARPALQVQLEEAQTPQAAFRAALTYTNVGRVWMRVVKNDQTTPNELRGDEDALKRLLKLPAVKAWSVALTDDDDHQTHVTELAVDGLPLGDHVLLVSDEESFAQGRSDIVFTPFTVTRIALAGRLTADNRTVLLATDRLTGAPLAGAKADLYIQRWENRQYRDVLIGSTTTDTDGLAELPIQREQYGQHRWTVTHAGEKADLRTHAWFRDQRPVQEELHTYLFTDRAIYRPGQPIHFKGIVTARTVPQGMGATNIVVRPGHRTSVVFNDVNGEEIARQEVTTDAYGSFHGQFTAPMGVLPGDMSIHEPNGMCSIRVEEYKRPTFEVLFDPVKTAPRIGEQASVSGTAKSYAGVPLDGAEVRWKVLREARMPWWCGWFWRTSIPWGRRTEIANGTATTDGNGQFQVTFTADADKGIARQAEPTFVYTVEASVVDINGESQDGRTQLRAGYRDLEIVVQATEALDRSHADSLLVEVHNLNDQPMNVPMDITIERLTPPSTSLRDRLWERPDRPVITRAQHDQLFPADVFDQENDPVTWPRQAVVLERKAWRAGGKPLALAGIRSWEVGTYRIAVSASDKDGKPLVVRKVFTVYDPAAPQSGFQAEPFHVEAVKANVQPGEKAVLLPATTLPEARVLMEVERNGRITQRRWLTLRNGQQRVELETAASDRGGFTVHFLCIERGREHRADIYIDVPWTNKELHVEWQTFRDKLLPGAKEEWRLRITGEKNAKVAAQLLAGLYDASLDHFVPHDWDLDLWPRQQAQLSWSTVIPFQVIDGRQPWWDRGLPGDTAHVYTELNTFGMRAELVDELYESLAVAGGTRGHVMRARPAAAPAMGKAMASADREEGDAALVATDAQEPVPTNANDGAVEVPQPAVRKDFRETAFFFPDLLTDKDGAVILKFTMPEALTRWKLLGLAHTTDLQVGTFTKETVTQKPLMVVPNWPRFLREGDRITLTAKINAIGTSVQGPARLELFDPFTNKPLDAAFGLQDPNRRFSVAPGQSANVAWDLTVPEGVNIVSVRITAAGNGVSDGEEKPLPVLTDKLLVTESLPLWTSGKGMKTFTLDKLRNNTSTTLRTQTLKLEYTPNPAWYAVQALPYLMEYPHACAEQTFSRYYANTLAGHIVGERPAIKQVFEQWKQAGPAAFASALEKNPELKGLVLEETPWVLNARNERESKERIALLFDLQRMGTEQAAALKKLRDMQLNNGAWPWWTGMPDSRYITQHIVAGFGHLEKLGAADLRPDGMGQEMIKSAVRWLDGDLERDYRNLVRNSKKEQLEQYVPSHLDVHFLYARSFFTRWAIDGTTRTAVDFHVKRLKATWLQRGLQEQAMAALALHRLGEQETARAIMASLSERATRDEERGMYWKNFVGGFDWWAFPTETHALLIEAFHDVTGDAASVNALRTYLLRLKQTTDWKTTKATSEACYALLLSGDDWLRDADAPTITVGGQRVAADKAEAGTGTFEHSWPAEVVKPAMGEVTITSTTDRPSWGALHWQYLERMDKITPHESPFSIRKQVFLKQATDAGTQLVAVGNGTRLHPGDRITIRMELRTDRAVDHVHLKDLRGAGLEPTETLSGYRFQGGLGFYRTTRDASVDFFFDRIMPGTYVLEYDLKVGHAGDFSNGITTAMCMYAPAYSSHSEGVRIVVDK